MCGILWLKPNTKRNFSSFGPVVSEKWPIFLDFLVILRTHSFSLLFWDFFHIFGHIFGTTGPIGLKFFVKAAFGHPVAHTKFQPLRLKDAEDIGWCVRNAGGARGFPEPVLDMLHRIFDFDHDVSIHTWGGSAIFLKLFIRCLQRRSSPIQKLYKQRNL